MKIQQVQLQRTGIIRLICFNYKSVKASQMGVTVGYLTKQAPNFISTKQFLISVAFYNSWHTF